MSPQNNAPQNDPKTEVEFPTFVRFNIASQNLSDDKKTQALTVDNDINARNTYVKDLQSTEGGLNCNQHLIVDKNIDVKVKQGDKSSFYGRVNLSNHTVLYDRKVVRNQELPQQYVPYERFLESNIKSTMRSATSGGKFLWSYAWVQWEQYEEKIYQKGITDLTVGGSHNTGLYFKATAKKPRLFRIGIVMAKHGGWIDNGLGGTCVLSVKTDDGKTTHLQASSSYGTSYYRSRPVTWIETTYFATQNGYFYISSNLWKWRVASLTWHVTQLPYYT